MTACAAAQEALQTASGARGKTRAPNVNTYEKKCLEQAAF